MYDVKFYEKKGWLIYNWEENIDYRITAKHGANISKKWPGGNWATSPGGSTFQANIDTMPLNGAKFYKTSQGDAKAHYYLQSLAGAYVWDHTDTGVRSGQR